MNTQTRAEIIAKFKEEVANGKILVGVGAGTGITAKSSEAGGADMPIIYNTGRYRMAGRGSLAGLLSYGDANQIVVEMGAEVLPVVKNTPVLAGVCGTDPFRVMEIYLKQLKEQGFNGVQNFPTVGLIDGVFRQNLEETGMGYGLEVEMVRKAHELDMLTCPYAFDPEQAKAMAEAGADILVAAVGKAGFVTGDMIKPGAAVIDVGINTNDEGKMVGDVDFEAVEPIVAAITPVPGGVGSVTTAVLVAHTVQAAARQNNIMLT